MFFNGFLSLIKNLVMDLRYSGRVLNGNKKTPYRNLGANDTYHTDYSAMSIIFSQIKITPEDILVDVGCGKGRVINYWLSRNHCNRIIGLELDPAIAAQASSQFRRFPNVSIIQGDAIENLPPDGTVFYFYNPFSLEKVYEFEKKLATASMKKNIRVLYYNPKSLEAFANKTWNIRYVNFEKDFGIKRWGRLNKYHDLAIITNEK